MDSVNELVAKWKSRWSAGLLEGYMFHLLSIEERFGGELIRMSQQQIEVTVKVPTIYAILKRSSEAGLVTVDFKESENGVTRGTQRKYYKLTENGKQYHRELTDHMLNSVSRLFELTKQIKEE